MDAALDAGEQLGILAGLPIVVKDNINTKDMPTSGGTPALQNARPTADADADLLFYGGRAGGGKLRLAEGRLSHDITSWCGSLCATPA